MGVFLWHFGAETQVVHFLCIYSSERRNRSAALTLFALIVVRKVQFPVRTFVGGIDDLSGLEYHAKKPMRSVCPLELLFHVQRYQAFNQSLQIPSNALNVGFFKVKKLFLRNLIPERLPT